MPTNTNYFHLIRERSSVPNISNVPSEKLISNKISNSSRKNQINSKEKEEIDDKQATINKKVRKYIIKNAYTKKLKPLKLKIQDDLSTMDSNRNKSSTIEILSKNKSSISKNNPQSPTKASKSPQKAGLLLENYHEEVFILSFS